MLKNPSMVKLTFMAFLLILFIFAASLGILLVHKEYNHFQRESLELEKNYRSEQQAAIRQEVGQFCKFVDYTRSTAMASLKQIMRRRVLDASLLAQELYRQNQGAATREAIVALIAGQLSNKRFDGGRSYYFGFHIRDQRECGYLYGPCIKKGRKKNYSIKRKRAVSFFIDERGSYAF